MQIIWRDSFGMVFSLWVNVSEFIKSRHNYLVISNLIRSKIVLVIFVAFDEKLSTWPSLFVYMVSKLWNHTLNVPATVRVHTKKK